MTMNSSVRPTPLSAAPDDFDDAMTARWIAWTEKGRVDRAQARRRLGAVAVVAAALAAGALAIATLSAL